MYNLVELLGKVVTIKSNKGEEFMAVLAGMNEEKTVITVTNPKVIIYSNDQVMTIPFALTADTNTVHLQLTNVFAIMPSLPESAETYKQIIEEEKPVEVEAEKVDA